MLKIYVDIDGTICETKDKDYANAVPIPENIAKINKLHDEGHYIFYWTARGSSSGIDWADITERQLRDWGCRYSMLSNHKKPSFDILIDDRAKRIEEI